MKMTRSEVNIDVGTQTRPQGVSQTLEERPFRILILGNFSGRTVRRPLKAARTVAVDPDNFEQAMAGLEVHLRLPVAGVETTLHFRELDDFEPDSLIAAEPLFRAPVEEARAAAAAEPPPAPSAPAPQAVAPPIPIPPGGSLLEAILGDGEPLRPDLRRPDDRAWDDVIHNIVKPHLAPREDPAARRAAADLDAAAGDRMRAALRDPGFQTLEANWRSLFFLLQRLETEKLEIRILDVTREELLEDVAPGTNLESSGLYRLLVTQARGTVGEDPWAAVAGLYTFSPTLDDCAALARIAAVAAVANVPFLAAADPLFIGCESFGREPEIESWSHPFTELGNRAWNALRGMPAAAHIGLALPRFLLRLPYGKSTVPAESFDFEEMPGPPEHDAYLWANPAVACLYLLAAAFNRSEWDLRPGEVTRIDRLPVHVYRGPQGPEATPCAEIWLTDKAAERIIDSGLMALASMKHSDAVQLVRFQSIADPPTALAGSWN